MKISEDQYASITTCLRIINILPYNIFLIKEVLTWEQLTNKIFIHGLWNRQNY
jgi:hypothetical protein